MQENEPLVDIAEKRGGKRQRVLAIPLVILLVIISTTLVVYGCSSSDSDNNSHTNATSEEGKPIPHYTSGQENCLACHNLYVRWPMPDNHEERELSHCSVCHEEAEEMPMSVPHHVKDNRWCTNCHAPDGFQYLSEVTHGPTRDNLSCLMCHTVGTPAVDAPHSEAAFEENACLQCHDSGGMAPVPTDHEGRHQATCRACHTRSSLPPMSIAHNPDESCDKCHASDKVGNLPVTHNGRSVETCHTCHSYFDGTVAEKHPIEPDRTCWQCHAPDEMAPLPLTHDGRGKDTCEVSVCHTEQYQFDEGMLNKLADHPPTSFCFGERGCHGWTDDPDYDPDRWITSIPSSTHTGRSNETCMACHLIPDYQG